MNRCPITYELLEAGRRYSKRGLKLLSPALKDLNDFPFSAEEQRFEAAARSSRLSIQGVQPKLSVRLSIAKSTFELVDRGGRFIFKPQTETYRSVPENEDLTMRLAETVGIAVPLHGLIRCKDGSLTYFIRRFDREGQKAKLHVEDFAQLTGESRETKYGSSMERVANTLERFTTFPQVEKTKLLERTLFSFLTGNEDMHLKNFSLLVRDGNVALSPAYDLVNSSIVIANSKEEMALPIRGRKNGLTREDLCGYFALEILGLPPGVVDHVLAKFAREVPQWHLVVKSSFLPADLQTTYRSMISDRAARLGLGPSSRA